MDGISLAMIKIIVLLVIICTASISHAQDNSKITFNQVATTQDMVMLNLGKCHKEFKEGTGLILAGALISGVAVLLHSKGSENNSAQPLLYIGAASVTIGWIVQIDSHKFIGRAGITKD